MNEKLRLKIEGIRLGPYPHPCNKNIDGVIEDIINENLFTDDIELEIKIKKQKNNNYVEISISTENVKNVDEVIRYVFGVLKLKYASVSVNVLISK